MSSLPPINTNAIPTLLEIPVTKPLVYADGLDSELSQMMQLLLGTFVDDWSLEVVFLASLMRSSIHVQLEWFLGPVENRKKSFTNCEFWGGLDPPIHNRLLVAVLILSCGRVLVWWENPGNSNRLYFSMRYLPDFQTRLTRNQVFLFFQWQASLKEDVIAESGPKIPREVQLWPQGKLIYHLCWGHFWVY